MQLVKFIDKKNMLDCEKNCLVCYWQVYKNNECILLFTQPEAESVMPTVKGCLFEFVINLGTLLPILSRYFFKSHTYIHDNKKFVIFVMELKKGMNFLMKKLFEKKDINTNEQLNSLWKIDITDRHTKKSIERKLFEQIKTEIQWQKHQFLILMLIKWIDVDRKMQLNFVCAEALSSSATAAVLNCICWIKW